MDVAESDVSHHQPPELRREDTFALLAAVIRQQANRHPLLILLEDVKWADPFTLELAAHLAQKLLDQAVFITLIYRPEAPLTPLTDTLTLPDVYSMRLEPL